MWGNIYFSPHSIECRIDFPIVFFFWRDGMCWKYTRSYTWILLYMLWWVTWYGMNHVLWKQKLLIWREFHFLSTIKSNHVFDYLLVATGISQTDFNLKKKKKHEFRRLQFSTVSLCVSVYRHISKSIKNTSPENKWEMHNQKHLDWKFNEHQCISFYCVEFHLKWNSLKHNYHSSASGFLRANHFSLVLIQ